MATSLVNITNFQKLIDMKLENHIPDEKDKKVISKLVERVIEHLSNLNNPTEDELLTKFIKKITIFNDKFAKAGQYEVFSTYIHNLELLSSQRKSGTSNLNLAQDEFVLSLNELSTNKFKIDGIKIKNLKETQKVSISTKLCNFQKNKLMPALQSAETKEEMEVLEDIILKCFTLSRGLSSPDREVLKKSREDIRALFKAKSVQTDRMYIALISYEKGNIGKLDTEEKREARAEQLTVFISEFVENSAHSVFLQEDKEAIYKAICTIHGEFQQYDDEKLKPILEKLSQSLSFPLPQISEAKAKPTVTITQRSSKFQNLMAQWDQSSTSGPSSSMSSKAPIVKKTRSEEEIRDAAIECIQTRISKLDRNSSRLKGDIEAIESAIQKLKSLSLCKKLDFTQLEEMLDLIKNPSALLVSPEEGRFVQLLLMDHFKLSQGQLEKLEKSKTQGQLLPDQETKLKMLDEACSSYFGFQKSSVEDAQSKIIQTLKKNANDIDRLLSSAKQVGDGLRDEVVRNRFNQFIEKNPTFANHSNYFPALVNAFAGFTNNVVIPELNKKWGDGLNSFDNKSNGKFSKLLMNYSYMDPTKDFNFYISRAQEHFLEVLDLKIPFTHSNLEIRLQKAMDKCQGWTASFFFRDYKNTFSKLHTWLANNSDKIVVPFNQGDHDNENLGRGVCFANAFFRYSSLIDDPKLKNENIQMGSNEKTRFVQRTYIENGKLRIEQKVSLDDVNDKVAETFGLKRIREDRFPVVKKDKTDYQNLMEDMENYANQNHTQCLLSLSSKDKRGHSLNIQIHIKNGIFRMMDDNIGIVQYSSLEDFKKEIGDYFRIFYSDIDEYVFSLYTK